MSTVSGRVEGVRTRTRRRRRRKRKDTSGQRGRRRRDMAGRTRTERKGACKTRTMKRKDCGESVALPSAWVSRLSCAVCSGAPPCAYPSLRNWPRRDGRWNAVQALSWRLMCRFRVLELCPLISGWTINIRIYIYKVIVGSLLFSFLCLELISALLTVNELAARLTQLCCCSRRSLPRTQTLRWILYNYWMDCQRRGCGSLLCLLWFKPSAPLM